MSYLAPSQIGGLSYLAPASEPASNVTPPPDNTQAGQGGMFLAASTINGRAYFAPAALVAALPGEGGGGHGHGGHGGHGGVGRASEVRAFAKLLTKASSKPSRSQRQARRKELESKALELLPDLPEAEKIAPIVARIVYEKEARALAPLYANRPIEAMQPVVEPFDAHAAIQDLVSKLLAEALAQQKLVEDEENDVELLLFGT